MKLQKTDKRIYQNLLQGEFGIEKESLRITADGRLAATAHPIGLNERISRDFSEGQVEFISGVYNNLEDACNEICSLQWEVEQAIFHRSTGDEYMWTYSNPPLFEEEASIRIAEFAGSREEKTTYREYLAQKYGKVKMLFSGVHLNYSMPKAFFSLLQEKMPDQPQDVIKSEWYVRLCDILMSDSWLLVALTSASPAADPFFLRQLGVPKAEWEDYASFRNSRYGYWNLFRPELSYRDFPSYIESIRRYIAQGDIDSIQELYYPIRLKPAGENTLEQLAAQGVNHIELRMLDLNPMCCAGVAKQDLIFIHLLIAYRTAELLHFWDGLPKKLSFAYDGERLALHQKAARFAFWEESRECRANALDLLEDMQDFFAAYEKEDGVCLPKGYAASRVLEAEKQKILQPDSRYANQLRKKYRADYIGARMREILQGS